MEGPKHTRFDSESAGEDMDLSDGECSRSPPMKRPRTPSPIIANADIVKGTERDFGDFFIDRTESIELLEESQSSMTSAESTTEAASDWLKTMSASFLSSDTDSMQSPVAPKERRNKPACFNCGGDHNVAQCAQPRDQRRIREAQQAMREKQRARLDNGRYHESPRSETEEKYRPGRLSSNLREALGIGPDDIPEWIYRMRRMGFIDGYPPAYLKRAIERDTSNQILKFHAIDGGKEFENPEEEMDVEVPPPIIDKNKMIYYLGFNQTYRSLRDIETNFRVPPFLDFVGFHQDNLDKRHREEEKERQRIRDRKKREARRKAKKQADDEEIMILEPPKPPVLDNNHEDEDCVVLEGGGDSSSQMNMSISEEANGAPPAPPKTPKGASISVSVGTPVLIRKTADGEELGQQHAPSLDAFTKGIVPFTATEEPTPHRGFMKRIVARIKEITGKQ